ncbi:MAG TPA: DUF4440 domain-containing protein [Terracidiphilus sp.]|nr:DUF4440 domain-containing protein [Terracidiphilus sp.]
MHSQPDPGPGEPKLTTAPELAGVLRELMEREPIFHRPEHGTRRADFERMTAPDFWETGASGRRYSRAFVLDELDRRYAGSDWRDDPWEAGGFLCRRLAEEVYLLTYTLVQKPDQPGARTTRRATIWERTAQGWRIVVHQGTIVE